MALDTVADFISEARVLLQDTFAGKYRYSDAELVSGLNLAFPEMYRLRPDMFVGSSFTLPTYSAASPSTAVDLDPRYRIAVLYYICAHAQMRDEENTEDARTAAFLGKFNVQLLGVQA